MGLLIGIGITCGSSGAATENMDGVLYFIDTDTLAYDLLFTDPLDGLDYYLQLIE